jgi:hypothetical protein
MTALTDLGWCLQHMCVWLVCCSGPLSSTNVCTVTNPGKGRQLCSNRHAVVWSIGIFRRVLLCRQYIVCCNSAPAFTRWLAPGRHMCGGVLLCAGSAAEIGLQHQCMFSQPPVGGKASSWCCVCVMLLQRSDGSMIKCVYSSQLWPWHCRVCGGCL